MTEKTFDIGDRVTWKSHAGSFSKYKQGVVVARVEAGLNPKEILEELRNTFNVTKVLRDAKVITQMRSDVSYLVAVEKGKSGKPHIYWPRTCWLEFVEKPLFEEKGA